MTKEKVKIIFFKDYLSMISKEELDSFLHLFGFPNRKNFSRKKLENLIYTNLDSVVISLLAYFQTDDYECLKKVLHKGGSVKIRHNHITEYFINNLASKNLMIQIDDLNYYIPSDLVKVFKKYLKKVSSKLFKNNTKEYNLILGILDAYGSIEYNDFYDIYSKDYKVSSQDAMNRIKELANFYGDFTIKKSNKKTYLVHSKASVSKTFNKYVYKKGSAVFTNDEFRGLNSLEYIKNFSSYKKYNKYLNKKYFIEKNNSRLIIKKILLPFLSENQINKEKAYDNLLKNIEDFFEIIDKKDVKILANYIRDLSHDYPRWELKGHSEKEKVC